MREIENLLEPLKDGKYAEFEAKLAPTVDPARCLGVRVPKLREAAKVVEKSTYFQAFLEELPHRTHDEDLLHAILISRLKPLEKCIEELRRFLPYVEDWSVCDTLRPKAFGKKQAEILPLVKEWTASEETYICRFGMGTLMAYYLEDAFDPKLPELVAAVKSDEYYVKMMAAWYFATALSKQWDAVIPFITEDRLPVWTHNKTIQKAKESFRITDEQKAFLNTLKR